MARQVAVAMALVLGACSSSSQVRRHDGDGGGLGSGSGSGSGSGTGPVAVAADPAWVTEAFSAPRPTYAACPGVDIRPARQPPLELRLVGRGSDLAVGLHNPGTAPVCVLSHVEADSDQNDWLTVSYPDGATPRLLRFDDDRDESAQITTMIDPGATSWTRWDVEGWALRPRNGARGLPPGPVTVSVVYESHATEAWSGRLEGTATLDIVNPFAAAAPTGDDCATAGYHAPAGAALELRVAVRGTELAVGLHDGGTEPVCMASHVLADETQSDWLVVRYLEGKVTRELALDAAREKSVRIDTTLAAGGTAWTRWDLAAWAKRDGVTLPSGTLWVTAVYDSTRETDVWAGTLSASATITVP